jgi:DNA-binding response OmpR family regulator
MTAFDLEFAIARGHRPRLQLTTSSVRPSPNNAAGIRRFVTIPYIHMRRTILLADDSPTIQRLITDTFVDSAFDVVSVSNGDAAIRKLEEIRPAVVLADIYMPGKNGFEVCAHVRNHASLWATPVILLVGAFDAFDEEVAARVGAAGSITKPFEPRALIDLVVAALNREPPEPPPSAKPTVPSEAAAHSSAAGADVDTDLMGLDQLFGGDAADVSAPSSVTLSDNDIDRIAQRVIQKISTDVIESIARNLVPGLAEKIVREELKKNS